MLKFLFILTTFFSINLAAQETITFEKIIKADSVDKEEIFVLINDWFATNYNSANDVIQMTDKKAGIIIGKGATDYFYGNNSSYNGTLKYTIKVYVKDNRFKVNLLSYIHKGLSINLGLITSAEIHSKKGMFKKYNNKAWIDTKLKAKEHANFIFTELEKKANSKKNNSEENDW